MEDKFISIFENVDSFKFLGKVDINNFEVKKTKDYTYYSYLCKEEDLKFMVNVVFVGEDYIDFSINVLNKLNEKPFTVVQKLNYYNRLTTSWDVVSAYMEDEKSISFKTPNIPQSNPALETAELINMALTVIKLRIDDLFSTKVLQPESKIEVEMPKKVNVVKRKD